MGPFLLLFSIGLPVVRIGVLRNHRLHSGDGYLDHAVIRLRGGEALEAEAGGGDEPGEGIGVPPGQLNKLVGDADDHRQGEEL